MAGFLTNLRNLVHGTEHTCPRWLCFAFDNPVRRLIQNPTRIVGPYVSSGDRVLDLGPGTGFLTLPLARLVGPTGEVVAADIQQAMLDAIDRRAERRGLANIRTWLLSDRELPPDDPFDFAALFWMLHEVRGRETLLGDILERLADDGTVLVVEPRVHVPSALFDAELESAVAVGFEVADRPTVPLSRAAVLRRRRAAA